MKKTIASKRELFCFFLSAVFLLPFSLVGLALRKNKKNTAFLQAFFSGNIE